MDQKKIVLNSIRLFSSSDIEVFPKKINFSDFSKNESSLNLDVKVNLFLIVVYLDTDGANQFPVIKVVCNPVSGAVNVSIKGKSYHFMKRYAKHPKNIFGIELIDINERHLFAPFAYVKHAFYEFEFSVNPNYLTFNGITF